MNIADMKAHYGQYLTLPREAMEELFAIADAQAAPVVDEDAAAPVAKATPIAKRTRSA